MHSIQYNKMESESEVEPSEKRPILEPSAPVYSSSSSLSGSSNGETRRGVHGGRLYSEEDLNNGVTCPTCRGTGKIPRGREDDLVALIPYNDARLKPRRTVLYVLLSIFACAAVAGILIAFLLPRPIKFEQAGSVKTVFSSYNVTLPQMILVLQSNFDVYNYNFPSLDDVSLTITASWGDQVVGTNTTTLNTTLGGRKSQEISGFVTAVFTEEFLVNFCQQPTFLPHQIYVQFTATYQYELLSQNQQALAIYYKAINCGPVKYPWIPGLPTRAPLTPSMEG